MVSPSSEFFRDFRAKPLALDDQRKATPIPQVDPSPYKSDSGQVQLRRGPQSKGQIGRAPVTTPKHGAETGGHRQDR